MDVNELFRPNFPGDFPVSTLHLVRFEILPLYRKFVTGYRASMIICDDMINN